jgi:hypothetical protein
MSLTIIFTTCITPHISHQNHLYANYSTKAKIEAKIIEIQLKQNIWNLTQYPRLMRIVYNDSLVEDFYLVNFSKKWIAECNGYTISDGDIIKVTYDLQNNSVKVKKFGEMGNSDDIFKISAKFEKVRINYSNAVWTPLGWQYEFRISGSSKNALELSLDSENSLIFYTIDKEVNWISCGGERIGWKCKSLAKKLRCDASCKKEFEYVYWFRLLVNSDKPAAVDISAVSQKHRIIFRVIVNQSEKLSGVEYYQEVNSCNRVSYASVWVATSRQDL